MSTTMNLKVRHGNLLKTIALYHGLGADELNSILQAVFSLNVSSTVVGLMSPEVNINHS